MKDKILTNLLVNKNFSIKETMMMIDRGGLGLALIVDEKSKKLFGLVSDGDIRGAILEGVDIEKPIKEIVNKKPVIIKEKISKKELLALKGRKDVKKIMPVSGPAIIPVVDRNREVKDIVFVSPDKEEPEFLLLKHKSKLSKRKVKSVLVIGGAGYLGSVLCHKLLGRGYKVRVLDSLVYGDEGIKRLYSNKNFNFLKGDIRNISDIVKAIKDVDAVIHLAAIVGDPACALNPKETLEINYLATKMIAEICKYYQINRFIFASSCSVYGQNNEIVDETSPTNPISLYSRTKIRSEEGILRVEDENFAPTILRLSTLYGYSPRMRFDLVVNTMTRDAINKKEISVHGGGVQWRSLSEVSDAARVFIRCLEVPLKIVKGQIFNVGSEKQNYQIRDIAKEIHRIIPKARLKIEESMDDSRSYAVSFVKVRKKLGFSPQKDITEAILEIKRAIESNIIMDVNHKKYSNVDYIAKLYEK